MCGDNDYRHGERRQRIRRQREKKDCVCEKRKKTVVKISRNEIKEKKQHVKERNTCFCVVGGEYVVVFLFSQQTPKRHVVRLFYNSNLLYQKKLKQISGNLSSSDPHTSCVLRIQMLLKTNVCSLNLASIYQFHLNHCFLFVS